MKTKYEIASQFDSPWSFKERVRMLLWEWVWTFFCLWTPKPLNRWRIFWLKCFGAELGERVFVHQRARIQIPWRLVMKDGACLGDRANAYSLGQIVIGERAIVAQEAYLCTGSHSFEDPEIPLVTTPIVIEADVFIGVRAMVLPGVRIGEGAVIGASSVVTKEMPAWSICVGQPCAPLKGRVRKKMRADL